MLMSVKKSHDNLTSGLRKSIEITSDYSVDKKFSQKSIIFCIRSGVSRVIYYKINTTSMYLRLWANDTARQNGILKWQLGLIKLILMPL